MCLVFEDENYVKLFFFFKFFPVVDPSQSAGRVCALLPVCGPMASHGRLALWGWSHRLVRHLDTLPHSCLENQPPPVRVCVCACSRKTLVGIWQMCVCLCAALVDVNITHTQTYTLLIMTQPDARKSQTTDVAVVMKWYLQLHTFTY